MIASGELASFDGLVAVEDLQRLFPKIALVQRLGEHGVLEKVAQIREQAFARRMQEFVLPSQELLAQRLFRMSVELAEVQRLLQAYHAMVQKLRAQIATDNGEPTAPRTLLDLIDGELRRILASGTDATEDTVSMLNAISAHVTVRPSGHQFVVEGNDSLLQAGLKAGLHLAYGCGTGTCGLCKARVVSGELRPIAHADYRLSAQEREQGIRLLCTHTAVSDAIIETIEAGGPQDIPTQEIVAPIRALRFLAPDTVLLHLQTPRTHRLRFLAGQSVTLGVADARGDVSESLPLASCPCDERNLHFHVALESGGPLAALVARGQLAVGQPIDVRVRTAILSWQRIEPVHPCSSPATPGLAPSRVSSSMRSPKTNLKGSTCTGWRPAPAATTWKTNAEPGPPA
jgi:CDP-4-dehydro-6-deoxyglucose reductase